MNKTLFAFILCAALVLSLAACGSAPTAETEPPAPESEVTEEVPAPAEDDGQNPVLNFVGVYHADGSTEALVPDSRERSGFRNF